MGIGRRGCVSYADTYEKAPTYAGACSWGSTRSFAPTHFAGCGCVMFERNGPACTWAVGEYPVPMAPPAADLRPADLRGVLPDQPPFVPVRAHLIAQLYRVRRRRNAARSGVFQLRRSIKTSLGVHGRPSRSRSVYSLAHSLQRRGWSWARANCAEGNIMPVYIFDVHAPLPPVFQWISPLAISSNDLRLAHSSKGRSTGLNPHSTAPGLPCIAANCPGTSVVYTVGVSAYSCHVLRPLRAMAFTSSAAIKSCFPSALVNVMDRIILG